MTPDPIEAHVEEARRYLSDGNLDASNVLDLRQRLHAAGYPTLARALSRRLAERFIDGKQMTITEVDRLWRACKTDEDFSHARRILWRRRTPNLANILPETSGAGLPTPPTAQVLQEQHALAISKDPDLAAGVRHHWALEVLDPDPERSRPETLGIAGGIWKRRWEADGQVAHLERSLKCYLAPIDRDRAEGVPDEQHDSATRGAGVDQGYLAINAAFICDLLAYRSEDEDGRKAHRERADRLRKRLCSVVKGEDYWTLVTLAEAWFGLGDVAQAESLLQAAARRQSDTWERNTTAVQLSRLGTARGFPIENTRRVVAALVGDGDVGEIRVRSVLVGKLGLALSGGGFRASLYHLGVLARLAESDLLRHVEALSTVSGGSMVGAAFYLRLRQLLGTNAAPAQEDYRKLVDDLIADFLKGTSANLRSGLFEDFTICRAILDGDNDIYAAGMARAVFSNLYSRTVDADPHMADVAIAPKGAEADFHPRYHNASRSAKVPSLIINATTLNTGHSWYFTTTSMGESPFAIARGGDQLPRLRRSYYTDRQGKTVRGVTLSQAVAASACVPGLFAPLALRDLYDDYTVGLVDGGVYDNQGALALLQEDCNVLIISDGCGQLSLAAQPGLGNLPPLMRSFDVFQERMRLGSFERLRAARESGRLGGFAYVHLKQDLEEPPLNWKNCEDPSRPGDQLPASTTDNPLTSYGVLKAHQKLLAAIRTDLDVFSEIESAALMASGYLAIDGAIRELLKQVPVLATARKPADWFFAPMLPLLEAPNPELTLHLEAGSKQAFRLMDLDAKVRRFVFGAAAVLVLVLAGLAFAAWSLRISFTFGQALVAVALLVAVTVIQSHYKSWRWVDVLVNPRGALRSRAIRWLSAAATSIVARRVVPELTRRYVEAGRLARLQGTTTKRA